MKGLRTDFTQETVVVALWTVTRNTLRIARMLGMPRQTVQDILARVKEGRAPELSGLVEKVKGQMTQVIVEKAITCLGLTQPRPDTPFRDLIWGFAVLLDKALLISGQATGRMEVKDSDPARTRERVTEIFRLIEQAHRAPDIRLGRSVPEAGGSGHSNEALT